MILRRVQTIKGINPSYDPPEKHKDKSKKCKDKELTEGEKASLSKSLWIPDKKFRE